uniref:Uncharacterized protein n=1 Tax=Wuchereria bancrofti TaxID=6293 RepID=A0A1I8EGI4_WUCBA
MVKDSKIGHKTSLKKEKKGITKNCKTRILEIAMTDLNKMFKKAKDIVSDAADTIKKTADEAYHQIF